VVIDGTSAIAEVEYFFCLQFGDTVHSLAVISVFSPPDNNLLRLSNNTAYICHHGGIDALTVVDVKLICGVVSMVPDYEVTTKGEIVIPEARFSMLEPPFLKVASFNGTEDDDNNDIDSADVPLQ
jgi:hypothetical protein